MAPNVLVTGAAGYIGGSLVADFLTRHVVEKEYLSATVRSDEQAKALSDSGINVFQLDLSDENAVVESVLRKNINIIIHTASCIDSKKVLPLITALGKRAASGEKTYFIHTSGLSAYYEKTGWPAGQFKDTDPLYQLEKPLTDSFPIREVDVAVIDQAEAQGVTSFIVVPSQVYGKGTGKWNQLSVNLPIVVKTSIARKQVSRFAENTKVPGVHISDLTALYGLLIEKILKGETIPSGKEGYYFGMAHDIYAFDVADRFAAALHARGLVIEPKPQVWPSDEVAAEALGVPAAFVQVLWNSGGDIVAEIPFRIGWKPEWNEDRFLKNIDDEIDAVLELGQAKSSLIDSLFEAAKGT